jgi:serine/threonine protein kinase
MADAGEQRSRVPQDALAAAVASGGVERYEKLGRIGEGTYGVVYRARDRHVVLLPRCRACVCAHAG